MKKVYLDYNATTPLDKRVIESMLPYLDERYGNPSSIHSFGMAGKAALDEAREQVAGLVGALPKEIVFTSGGTESNNAAIVGAAMGFRDKGAHLITTAVEHASVLETFRYLEGQGFRVTYLGVDGEGLIDLDELRDSITEETLLVSVIYVNNETGVISPIEEIAEIVKERGPGGAQGAKGVLFHTDAVQAAGKLPIDLASLPVDLLSLSSHKVYGPKGVGALFVRSGLKLPAYVHGGGQERGRRSGTENVPGIVGFGRACELVREGYGEEAERIKTITSRLEGAVFESIDGVELNGRPDGRVANTINVRFEGVEGEAVVMSLDLDGVAVSTGSACSEGNVDPSHVLLAMGLTKVEALSSVRISTGRFTTEEEVARALELLPAVVRRIRSVGSMGEAGEGTVDLPG